MTPPEPTTKPEPSNTSANRADAPTGVVQNPNSSLNGPFPKELDHWNWGAFLLNWIWAVTHNVWIGLLALIPYVGVIMAIILGIKGNEFAWQHRKFESIDEFKAVQKAWTRWAILLLVFFFLLGFILVILGFLVASQVPHQSYTNY